MKKIIIFYILTFIFLFFTALTFNYVEGDDASTVIYHVMGRDSNIQPPYAPYNSMFDKVLSFLPQNEKVIRVIAFAISFISGLLFLISTAFFIRYFFKASIKKSFFFLIPFIIPEFFISSLTIDSTKLGMSFMIMSFLFTHKYLSNLKWQNLIIASVCFGLGASFRWNLVGVLIINIGIIISFYLNKLDSFFYVKKAIIQICYISLSFLLSFSFFLFLSGYSLFNVIEVFLWGSTYMSGESHSLMRMLPGLSWLTPAFLLLIVFGFIEVVLKKKYQILLIFLFSILPLLIIGYSFNFKLSLAVIPSLLIIALLGYNRLIYKRKNNKYILLALIFIPWVIGFQFNTKKAWGPKFEVSEVREIDRSATIKETIRLVFFKAGTAFPMPEGPRSIYGYFGLLFGGDWKSFMIKRQKEREDLILASKSMNLLISSNQNATLQLSLIAMGYKNILPAKKKNDYFYRDFIKKDADTIRYIYPAIWSQGGDIFEVWMHSFLQEQNIDCVYVGVPYSSLVSKLSRNFNSTEILGPLSIKVWNPYYSKK